MTDSINFRDDFLCQRQKLLTQWVKMDNQVGAVSAILSSIKTRVDGSVTVSLEVNPSEIQVINKLMQSYLLDKKVFTVAFVQENTLEEF